ncbi:MAG: dephospho-CoA kinase [Clostridiales bacterium]|nr:dephospho-CoA kinase [Clostridiales bacterium]
MKRKVIAITGKIGSGKSSIAHILNGLGFKTVDCDELAKQVANQPDVVKQVEQLLGSKCVSRGKLNRKVIRDIVFEDENMLKEYERIFFDGVRMLLTDTLARLPDEKVVFVEIPVLDAFTFTWDEIWRVESDQQTNVRRVAIRDNVSEDNVYAILNSQKPYDCDYVIYNNGDLNELAQAVVHALTQRQLL